MKAPKHLSREAKAWWRRIAADYAIEDEAGVLLLQTALESFDEMRRAQALVKSDGLLIPHGDSMKLNPAAGAAKDARAHMMQALKALNLDIEPPGRPGAPEAGP